MITLCWWLDDFLVTAGLPAGAASRRDEREQEVPQTQSQEEGVT